MKDLMRLRTLWPVSIILACFLAIPVLAAQNPPLLPLEDVHPGMKGVAYTIFSGDQIQPVNLTVIGILRNAMGPKQDVILVQLEGPEVDKTGVVAGMSGSPVYFDGRLAGAISLKIGTFTKDAIAGVTPIESMLAVGNAVPKSASASSEPMPSTFGDTSVPSDPTSGAQKIQLGQGQFLSPIETPLVFSGVLPQTISRFSSALAAFGMTAMAGGTAPPEPDDAQLKPGDMVGMSLVSGDISLAAGCTVTAIIGDRVFVCGHPLNGFGSVTVPMMRAHVVMTLASALESTKIMNTGGTIGTITQDRLTAVMGKLGAAPPTIPVEVNVSTPTEQKHFHFNVTENPKLTPLLVAISAYNGLVMNTSYTEGTTLELNGRIDMAGHPAVQLHDMFVPTDSVVPDGFGLAISLESTFSDIYLNPYEQPDVRDVILNVKSIPEWRAATIDGAWSDRSEAKPGETVHIKVLLRPYRGTPSIQEVPITIPPQAARGSLQVLVSDSAALNHMRGMTPEMGQDRLRDLDEMIRIINRERQNDRLYVTLLQNAPTLLVEDKELPNAPPSEINVLDQRRVPGGAQLLSQSIIGERSVELNQVISGQQYLTITIK